MSTGFPSAEAPPNDIVYPPPCLQARQGVFDPPALFPDDLMSCFDVLMSCFLDLKRAHSPEDGFRCVARAPLFTSFLHLFSDLLVNSDLSQKVSKWEFQNNQKS